MGTVALVDEYAQMGLFSKPSVASNDDDHVPEASANVEQAGLINLIEFPDPFRVGETRTLTVDVYNNQKDDPTDDQYKQYAIVVRKVLTSRQTLKRFQIELQSRELREVFKELGRSFADLNVDNNPIIISRPFHPLFFLREKLQERISNSKTSPRTRSHIRSLLDFVGSKECLYETITRYESLVPSNKISFDMLWSLFRPNELSFYHDDNIRQCFIVESCYPVVQGTVITAALFNLISACHEGSRFGLERRQFILPAFLGVVEIASKNLPIIPLNCLPEKERKAIKTELAERGKAYCKLQEAKYTLKLHSGPMWSNKDSFTENRISFGEDKMKIHTNGRVVVDSQACRESEEFYPSTFIARTVQEFKERVVPKGSHSSGAGKLSRQRRRRFPLDSSSEEEEDNVHQSHLDSVEVMGLPGSLKKDKPQLTNDDYILYNHRIEAFLLDRKKWILVLVTDLKEIEWYPDPWESLQLDPDKKKLVYDLVHGFNTTENVFAGFDDIVEGKGKGLIFLLHGLPGLGKTFTAEAIAEQTKRPLYCVTAGELSTDVSKLEENLQTAFKLGWRWGAVVLIDEADVIMAERNTSDLERSAVVAVFLRLIEYYRGLLFLTTNRKGDIDSAFHNRIHVMIEYPILNQESRKQIWRGLLKDKKKDIVHLDASWENDENKIYDILGELDINGRDIRNLIRTAYGIARSRKTDLGVRHILSAMELTCRAKNVEDVSRRLMFAARRAGTM